MSIWKGTLFAALCCAAGNGWATPAEDFIRGSAVELRGTGGEVHVTAFLTDQRSAASSRAPICATKASGTPDLAVPFHAFGIPVVVNFTGAVVDANHVRFTVDQVLNQCVVVDGASRLVRRVQGKITAALNRFEAPTPGTCAADFGQSLQVMGGGESDLENQLVFDVGTTCDLFALDAAVIVHDIVIDGLAGRLPPPLPLEVSRFAADRTFICPPPERPLTVPARLTLLHPGPYSGVAFGVSSSDPRVTLSRPDLMILPSGREGTVTATLPAGFVGSLQLTATGPGGVTATSHLNVTTGLAVFGGRCRMPKFLAVNRGLRTCLACGYRGRLRGPRPASEVARSAQGTAFMSAMSGAGTAGYSTLEGKLVGRVTDTNGALLGQFADTQLFDLNDFGKAIGTYVDPATQAHLPVQVSDGKLEALSAPSGFGEARVVNNSGIVAGFVLGANNAQQAALWEEGVLRSLHPQAASHSEVVSLSDDGVATVQAWDSAGRPFASTWDVEKKVSTPFVAPKGFDGVELIGATREGLVAGHLLKDGHRSPFIDYGAGLQLLQPMSPAGVTIDRLISLDADGALLASVTQNGAAEVLLLDVK